MDDLLTRLIGQLDTLIPFIGISRENVFKLIQQEKQVWFPNREETFPDTYEIYKKQINDSAFILGYSYFEAFLSDLVELIFLNRPSMLPKDKKLSFNEITKVKDYEEVKKLMVDKEIHELFYKNIHYIIKYFKEKLQLDWNDDSIDKFREASYLRNCLVHNMGYANFQLTEFPGYKLGETFELTSSQVHSFGVVARNEARNLWKLAIEKHIKIT